VSKCFTWDADCRIKPHEALVDEWILEGLPEEIKY
jgi:hypothetical protein